jgi:regulator of protease activity HflC (stomatin/prohibitin superfamily)
LQDGNRQTNRSDATRIRLTRHIYRPNGGVHLKRQVRSKTSLALPDATRLKSLALLVLAVTLVYLLYTYLAVALDLSNATLSRKFGVAVGVVLASGGLVALVNWNVLTLGIIVFPLIGALLRNGQGAYMGIVGAIFWLLATVFAALLGLAFYARFILPLHGTAVNSQGLNLLIRYALRDFLPMPTFAVNAENVVPSFKSFGAGFVPSHEVLALTKGVGFRRGIGPGFVRLAKGETVQEVVDLRLQCRSRELTAKTRDGIIVKTTVTVWFRVRPPTWQRDPRMPYPYDERSVFDAFYARTLDDEQRELAWSDRVAPQAANQTMLELSRVNLDSLSMVNNLDVEPLADVVENVTRSLYEEFERQGVRIVDVAIGTMTVPDEVMSRRMALWRSRWDARIRERKDAQLGREIGRIDPETARIQMEVVAELIDNIETLRMASDRSINHTIADRMLRLLEDAATEGVMRTMIPGAGDDV